jgi:hypothetical protein
VCVCVCDRKGSLFEELSHCRAFFVSRALRFGAAPPTIPMTRLYFAWLRLMLSTLVVVCILLPLRCHTLSIPVLSSEEFEVESSNEDTCSIMSVVYKRASNEVLDMVGS